MQIRVETSIVSTIFSNTCHTYSIRNDLKEYIMISSSRTNAGIAAINSHGPILNSNEGNTV